MNETVSPDAVLDLSGALLDEAKALYDETDGLRLFLPRSTRKVIEARVRLELVTRLHALLDKEGDE